MVKISRRDFIRTTSCAMGGVILSGCGSGNGGLGGGITTPSGYYFYRLKTEGNNAGTGSRSLPIYEFGASVHISTGGIITFDAFDIKGRQGLFQLDVDFTNQKPLIYQEHTSLLTGDVLADGRDVKKFISHDVNRDGNIAAVIKPAASSEIHYGSGLYLNHLRGGFEPILGIGDKFHQDQYESTGIMGDISLDDENSLLLTANHLTGSAPRSSLFHLPGSMLSNSRQVMSTGDFVNGSDEFVTGFGIVDHNAAGHFSSTISHAQSGLVGAVKQPGAENPVNGLLQGHLANPNDHFLLSAGPNISASTHTASVHYGPRVASDGMIYSKIADQYKESLIAGDEVIKTTDGVSSQGDKISSFTPGCTGADGAFYYTEYSESESGLHTVLFAYDGVEHKEILSSGNTLSDGGSPVRNILFSTTTNHVADDGNIVLLCEFADKSTSIVVGIPV